MFTCCAMAALLGGTGGGTDPLAFDDDELLDDDAPELEFDDVEEALRWACLLTPAAVDDDIIPEDLALDGDGLDVEVPAAAAGEAGLTTRENPDDEEVCSPTSVVEVPAAAAAAAAAVLLLFSHSLPMDR